MIKFKILLLTSLLLIQGTEQKKYTLDKHKIEFTVDTNWEYQKVSDDTYVFKFKCAKEVPFCKNITIRVINNTNKETIDQLTQALVDYIPKRFEQYHIISVRDEKVNDRQFRVIDYKFREEHVDLGSTTLVTQRDNEFISIYFTALNQPEKSYVNERKLLFELLKTFSVK
jgi:hypothetical protein